MRDILPTVQVWREQGKEFALATVVRTWGSSIRKVGSCMAISASGEVVGSVSAGCVEGAVIESARRTLNSGNPEFLKFESISDERAWEVGLSCGGELEVWVEPQPKEWEALATAISEERAVAREVIRDPFSSALIEGSIPRESTLSENRFLHVLTPRSKLIIIGAGHLGIALAKVAKLLDFRLIVVDPRSFFSDSLRFDSPPDELHTVFPHQYLSACKLDQDTFAVALSHDSKIDEPALEVLLKSDARYVGALGSKVTQAKRRTALLKRGVTETQLAKLQGPVGLDIGAKTPEEIAVSILAQIIKERNGPS